MLLSLACLHSLWPTANTIFSLYRSENVSLCHQFDGQIFEIENKNRKRMTAGSGDFLIKNCKYTCWDGTKRKITEYLIQINFGVR